MSYPRYPDPFCNAVHPLYYEPREVVVGECRNANGAKEYVRELQDVPYVFCRRMARHSGAHSAYTFSISVPERWTDE